MNVATRPWRLEDLPAIQAVLRETWLDAYGSFIPHQDLSGYLEAQYSQAKLEALFADPDVRAYVAEVDGAVAGYAKTFHARSQLRFYLHQLYVLPSRQKLGLGQRLLGCAEARARELGHERIWVGVMVQNQPAVAWYRKRGYAVTAQEPFVMGTTKVDHYIGYLRVPMAPAPDSGARPSSGAGTLGLPQAFE